MLDLNAVYDTQLYQVRLFDGTILNLKRPTQQLQEAIMGMGKFVENNDNEALFDASMSLLARIFNRNTEGIEFKAEEMKEDYDFSIAMLVLKDYFEYWTNEVMKKVDFQNTQQ